MNVIIISQMKIGNSKELPIFCPLFELNIQNLYSFLSTALVVMLLLASIFISYS